MSEGKCDHCQSTDGHWFGNNWDCHACGKLTNYYTISELGKKVLRVILDGEDKS